MRANFNHFESVYWVFTQLCNDECAHCYNMSGPRGARISMEDCMAIVDNLPEKMDRLILSGGEPLAEREKLYAILDKVKSRYGDSTQIMLQTNGDLLNESRLATLIEKGVTRFDIASIDRYHKHKGARLDEIATLFDSAGVRSDKDPLIGKDDHVRHDLTWGYWGATEDMWLGGNWARGRAMTTNVWKRDPKHNPCGVLSGAIGFLGGKEVPMEVSIQLWAINPCCPGTKDAMGDARKEKVSEVVQKTSKSAIFQELNEGSPLTMGLSLGITEEYAKSRTEALENVCLWCDEFFDKHFDMKTLAERKDVVL